MKFSHSLKFNAVPEWSDNYVNYPSLKKVIYKLQQDQLSNQPQDGSLEMNHVNGTTVTQVVNESKSVPSQKSENGVTDRKFSHRLISRFRKQMPEDDEKTVGSSNVGTSGMEFQERNEKEKNQSTESFTIDLDSSTIVSLNAKNTGYTNPLSSNFDPLKVFTKLLLIEMSKINDFYQVQEAEIFQNYDNLIKDLEANRIHIDELFKMTHAHRQEMSPSMLLDEHHTKTLSNTGNSPFEYPDELGGEHDPEKQNFDTIEVERDSDDDDEEEDDDESHSQNSALLSHTDFNVKQQKQITLKKKSISLFIALSELKSFIELNRIGFTKITKKFDKTCNYSIKRDFIDNYLPNNSRVFLPETLNVLDFRINQIIKIYSFLSGRLTSKTTMQDLENVRVDLKSHLRDHIVWERNTVWKDLLSLEKNSYNLHLDDDATQANKMGDEGSVNLMHLRLRRLNFPRNYSFFGYNHVTVPSCLLTWQVVKLIVIVITFIVLMCVKTFNDPEQHRCLALLVAAAMLWASEALPLYITGMLVPFLTVACKVLKDEKTDKAMSGPDASKYILGTMWSSVIMLLMGGFTLAGALSKYNIAKVISSYILAVAGTKPKNVLISIMAVSLFLSMWISNVAAPVLCYSLIQPVLRTLPTESPFAQALVLGIALASNIAGMASPIASPQNMIAIESMQPNPGWGKWFAVALPIAIIGLIGIWFELILTFKINTVKIKAYKPIKEKFTTKQIFISIVTIATILLWCLMTKIEGVFGESGIISIIPIVLFFGTGLLKVDDLNNYPWSIILLAMGGIALGKAVTSSGLLKTIATALQHQIEDFNVFVILIIFGILILVVATFVSHTVAALIIIPLVKEVGEHLPEPHPLILVMGTALIASSAMGLPTSGFPNVTAISMRDEVGKPYLTVNTFITRGVPASFIAYACVVTIGYGIMTALKF